MSQNTYIPLYERTHQIYLKLEIQKRFPDKKLYFIADYPRPGDFRVPEFDFADKKNLSDNFIFKINPKHLEEIQNSQAFLVYDAWMESGEVYVMWLYEKCVKAKIPTEQVILIGSSFDYTEVCDKYAKHYNVKPITHVYYSFFERDTKRHFLTSVTGKTNVSRVDIQSINVSGPLDTNNIEKRFIYLNYTSRVHRHALLMMLYRDDLLKHGYVSFHNKITEKDFDNISFMLDYFDEPVKTMLREGQRVGELFPIKLDDAKINPLSTNPALSLTDDYIQKSFLHVVSETFYGTKPEWVNTGPGSPDHRTDKNTECVFLTEKVFNCIHFKQPFILLSYPNSLDAFKRLGYKTFDGIIDESYDKEINDTIRLYKVFQEIKKICELDESTLNEYRLKLQPILEYNYNLWLNKTNYMY